MVVESWPTCRGRASHLHRCSCSVCTRSHATSLDVRSSACSTKPAANGLAPSTADTSGRAVAASKADEGLAPNGNPRSKAAATASSQARDLQDLRLVTFPDARLAIYPWMAPPGGHQGDAPPVDTRAVTCPACQRVILAFSLDYHRTWCPEAPPNLAEEMGAGNGMTARGVPKRAAAMPRGARTSPSAAAAGGAAPAAKRASGAKSAGAASGRVGSRADSGGGSSGQKRRAGSTGATSGGASALAAAVAAPPAPPRPSPLSTIAAAGAARAAGATAAASRAPSAPVRAAGGSGDLRLSFGGTPRKLRSTRARSTGPRSPAFLPFSDAPPQQGAGSKRANWLAARPAGQGAKRTRVVEGSAQLNGVAERLSAPGGARADHQVRRVSHHKTCLHTAETVLYNWSALNHTLAHVACSCCYIVASLRGKTDAALASDGYLTCRAFDARSRGS